jgi:sporulation protein YlmC with PRC-barrel domain
MEQGVATMTTASGHTTAITARKVINTDVFDATGNKIGEVKDIVLDKTSNNIMFAVLGFGGVLGMGEKYHPVPWSELDYAKDRDGYTINLTKEQLQAAPNATLDELTRDDGRAYRDLAFAHYKTKPYWH